MVEEKFLAKIIPIDNPDLKEVKLSLNTETCLGRGRKTNILDKYISRNQIRIKLIKTQSGYKLDFTPLAKPSFIQRENEANIEIQAGKTEVLSPNDTFYISRLKFPYKFQLLPEIEEENEADEATPEDLSRDGPTVDEANLPAEIEPTADHTEEATNVDNKDDNVEEAEIEIDAGEKLDIEMEEENEQKEENEEENETTDANKTVDEVDYDQRLDEEQEDDSVIIEYSQENIKSTVNIDNNNVSPKERNVLISKEVLDEDYQPKEEEVEKEVEKEVEVEEEKEEKEEEKEVEMEEEIEEKEEELEEEKKEEEKEEEEKEVTAEDAMENSTSTQDIFPISQSSPTNDATRKITIQETIITEEITSPPAIAASSQVIHNYPPLSSDPSFILLMNKVSSLESQLKTVLGEFGEKLNKVVEICSPRVSIQKPKQDGYESDVSSEAKESPSVKRVNTKVIKKGTPQKTEEDLEKQREKERKEKEAKEAKELEKKKEKERKEKEREKERIRKEKEKQEKKERERLEKEAKQKEREKQKEEEAKAKKTPPPKSGKRKRSESEDVAESPASQPNKKKKSEASEKWSADQERRFRWAGDQYKANQKTFYSAVVIDDETYSIGDTVYLTSPIDVPYYIGKILALWEDNKGKKLVQISWFFYHADVTEILGPKVAKQFGVEAFQKKLYGSIQTDINPVVTIERKCDVKHLSELGEFASNPKKWAVASADRYYFEKYFDSRTKKISYNPDTDSLEMMFEYPDKRIS